MAERGIDLLLEAGIADFTGPCIRNDTLLIDDVLCWKFRQVIGVAHFEAGVEEQLARIWELGRRLGFNEAKTKMLLGQSLGDLAGLERKLLNELDQQPGRMPDGNGDKSRRGQPKKEASLTTAATTSDPPAGGLADGSAASADGFLF